jgi:quercetin dioxygenase-like cupin family protein
MKLHANFKIFASVHFDASQYLSSPSYGVNRFMLDRIGNEKARATTIVEYQPNSKFPEHIHIGGEEFFVLTGTFQDQHGAFPAGTYVRNPIGSKHSPWVEGDGCTILVKLLQMAETPGEGITPLHIHVDQAKDTQGVRTAYGTALSLYRNEYTGEVVEVCWIQPDNLFPWDENTDVGGEELFVLDGSLIVSTADEDDDDDSKVEEYLKWGWMRFPPGVSSCSKLRSSLKAGSAGAQVYRKTGHLTDKAMAMEKIQITDDN